MADETQDTGTTPETGETVETTPEPVYVPPQLSLEILRKPQAGDNAEVYPTDAGWEAKYPDGATELLIECKGLKTEFDRLGLDNDAKPIEGGLVWQQANPTEKVYQRGEVISSTVTWDLLNSLDMAGLRQIGNVLGVTGTSKDQLRADIAEKVGLSKDTDNS